MLSAFSSKASISDGMGCINAYTMGSLRVLEGPMNTERYIKVLEKHMQMTCISAGQCKTSYCSYSITKGFVVEEPGF